MNVCEGVMLVFEEEWYDHVSAKRKVCDYIFVEVEECDDDCSSTVKARGTQLISYRYNNFCFNVILQFS